jgi:hypothetical protein
MLEAFHALFVNVEARLGELLDGTVLFAERKQSFQYALHFCTIIAIDI